MKKWILIFFILCCATKIYAQEEIQPALEQIQEEALSVSQPDAQNKISLDIKGMDIVDVLKILADRAALNLVIGKNVTGRVTLFLKDVEISDAFEIILLANELACERKGKIINVMTQRDYELIYGNRYKDAKQAKIVQLKYAKAADLSRALNQIKTNVGRIVVDEGSNTLALIDTAEKINEMLDFIKNTDLPVQTRVFSLNYAQADKIQAKIQETLTKGVGYIRIDERTNKVAVTDYPEKINEVANIIAAFDEKTAQVLIDAQIIELKPSDKFEMGVDWDYWIKNHFEIKSSLPVGAANRLLVGTTNTAPSEPGDYKAIVDLLRTIGDTKILSSPRIMAINNQEAKILVGTKDAYITSTSSQAGDATVTSQSVNFVDVGIKLYVTPTVNRDGFVTMKIRPEISSSTRTNITTEGQITQIPIVTTSEAETTVMVKDGITIIIGGLRKDERTKEVKKIPLLGDIPLLGYLFRSTSDENKKTELVILLTPHIMSGETTYSDFSEIRPKQGAIAKMVKGNIITEKVSSVEQEKALSSLGSQPEPEKETNYYQLITNKIKQSAKLNSAQGKQGEVNLNFSISLDGNLAAEPKVINATDPALIPPAIKAIKDAAPYPALPKTPGQAEKTFYIAIDYR